jgi:hypothetical protein
MHAAVNLDPRLIFDLAVSGLRGTNPVAGFFILMKSELFDADFHQLLRLFIALF